MRTTSDAFHLAIPTHDLDAAQDFYVTRLGCKLARRYADRITLDFFGDQVVCHLVDGREPAKPGSLYPNHFGVTFREAADFEALHACAVARKIPFYHDVSRAVRGAGGGAPHVRADRTRPGTSSSSSTTTTRE